MKSLYLSAVAHHQLPLVVLGRQLDDQRGEHPRLLLRVLVRLEEPAILVQHHLVQPRLNL